MGKRNRQPDRIVFDPAVRPWELRVLRAADSVRMVVTAPVRHVRHRADRILAAYLLIATAAAAVYIAVPVPWAWAWFLAAVAVPAALAAAAARPAARHYRGRYVNPARMDPASRQVLERAQAAVRAILDARISREGQLGTLALDAREWEVASLLGRACELAEAQARLLDGAAPSPAALSQAEILRQVRDAAVRQTAGLEACASQVQAADAAYRAHSAAGALAGLDPLFLDLLAGTAAGDVASGEVDDLRDGAAAAERVFTPS